MTLNQLTDSVEMVFFHSNMINLHEKINTVTTQVYQNSFRRITAKRKLPNSALVTLGGKKAGKVAVEVTTKTVKAIKSLATNHQSMPHLILSTIRKAFHMCGQRFFQESSR